MDKTKIDSLIVVNNEILNRIEAYAKQELTEYQYFITSTPYNTNSIQFKVQETTEKSLGSKVIDSWKCNQTFEEIPDIFNCNLNYTVTNYKELKETYTGMCNLIHKAHAFLGEAINTIPALKLFKKNFEIVQICLGELEGTFLATKSELEAHEEKIKKINLIIQDMSADKRVFWSSTPLAGTSPSLSVSQLPPAEVAVAVPEFVASLPKAPLDVSVHSSSSYHSDTFAPHRTIANPQPLTSYWLSVDGKVTDEWITYDLKSEKKVTQIGLISSGSYTINPKSVVVLVSDNGGWKEVAKLTMASGPEANNKWQLFKGLFVYARLVRLLFKDRHGTLGGNYLLLSGVAFME